MYNIKLKFDTSYSSVASYVPQEIKYDYSLTLPFVPSKSNFIKLTSGEFYVENIIYIENEDYILLTGRFKKAYSI